jgi:hypothetical protein
MSLTNPPAFITQLDTQFRACASWTGATNTWYPSAPDGSALPFAVYETTQDRTPYAEGARGLASNEFVIAVSAVLSVGQMETLAESIINELSLQFNGGIPFRSFAYDLSSDIGAAEVAGGETSRTITITGSSGLSG